jgi:hypothetical protein
MTATTATAAAATATTADALPSRDELVLAWGDSIAARLSGLARGYYLAGRFVHVADGAAVFALPNEPHRAKCESMRDVVEAALAEHFGRPVPLRLVVDDGSTTGAGRVDGDGGGGEYVDIHELRDAPAVPQRSAAERLTEAFPGAEVLEGDHP